MRLYQVVEFEFNEDEKRNAQSKARIDISEILSGLEAKEIEMNPNNARRKAFGALKKMACHFSEYNKWKRSVRDLENGDILVIQFPVLSHTILLSRLFGRLKRRGVKVILVLHDLELLRNRSKQDLTFFQRLRITVENKKPLRNASCLMTHNERMNEAIVAELGEDMRSRCVAIELFDYLTASTEVSRKDKQPSVVIAGNLTREKAGYLSELPLNCRFRLYGNGYESNREQRNVEYCGSYPPDVLPSKLVGSYGLVWDGPSSETCSGVYGEYLRVNNPHKTSLYFAAGLPVVVWSESAVSSFVLNHGAGIVVSNLSELGSRLNDVSAEEYNSMRFAAEAIGDKLKMGYFTTSAMKKCIEME